MKIRYENRAGELSIPADMRFCAPAHCDLAADTGRYAVRRLFTRCAALRDDCTALSWRLRVASGRARKGRRVRYLLRAAMLELPGTWARITVAVDAAGITVQRLELLDALPESSFRTI